ncbi:MAG: transporter related protein [Solirubrobacterales bacterium]|jgi:ABC-type lipoprotein export system ATPase subunit|nr:transporter related protein [Solirubrobacterales bacterium]
MSLLSLENVSKRYGDGRRERVVLSDVSLQLDAGELAAVWGLRRSGRSTLLHVAAGIEAPDTGVVRFLGRDLARHRDEALGGGIGYCQQTFRAGEARTAREHVTLALLARGVVSPEARSRASAALERTGATSCASLPPAQLDGAEAVRVALARTLALRPQLLVVDEPAKGVDLLARDEILTLLRSLADDGIAVLASTGEATGLSGADRALSLGDGELHESPARHLAPVVPLRRAAG